MHTINEHIKQNIFKPIYLLYGEEAYLKQQYKNKLKTAILMGSDEMNYHYFEGKGVQVDKIIEYSETLPFFHDKRLIIIENSGLFKKQNDLSEYISSIPETTHIVFVETEVDKRGKLYKEIKKCGVISEMNELDEASLKKWILSLLKKENKKITLETLEYFVLKVGVGMMNIKQELEKLICYTLGSDVITNEDVDNICTTNITNKIFDMINAIAEKKQKRALDLYYDLLSLKEAPMRILFLIARQFNLLYQIKDMKRLGLNQQVMGQKIGLQGFVVNKYLIQEKNFKLDYLRMAVEECVATEEAVKTGKIVDTLGVELLIIKFSSS